MAEPNPCSSDALAPAPGWDGEAAAGPTTRRGFLLATLAGGLGLFVAGCGPQRSAALTLPGPVWRPREFPPFEEPAVTVPTPLPNAVPGVLARTHWAGGAPVNSLLNRMLPVRFITIHHDGMDPFYGNDQRSTAERLERIRRAHRAKGWGDIGYHFAVDRGGRVWEGRPLIWQGAHVKDRNEGNIGVVSLGNFDQQSPSPQQLQALTRITSQLMRQFGVPRDRLKTHKEWDGAVTACPGANLQRYVLTARSGRQFG